MRRFIIGALLIGLWVSVYILLQSIVAGRLGISETEFWPVLMSGGMIALLGGHKRGLMRYLRTGAAGILAAFLYLLVHAYLLPYIGIYGLLLILSLIIAAIIVLGRIVPEWFGGGCFIMFTAATILTSGSPLQRTAVRLVVLIAGTAIFICGEHLIKTYVIMPADKRHKAAPPC